MNMAAQFADSSIDKVKLALSEVLHRHDTALSDPAPMLCGGENFELLAAADRTSFVLRSKRDFYVAHLVGEEAARFDADYQAARRQHPAWPIDQTLSQLWNQGGYMWFAAQDAD